MPTALKLAWLLVILVGSVGPGLLLIRRLRMSPLERLCAAIVCSQALLYLFAGTVYLLDAPQWSFTAGAIASLVCLAASRKEIAALAANRAARRAILGFGLLFAWALLLLANIRTFSGGRWAIDWAEHYERTRFFLERRPLDTVFIGGYSLTARPPLMNLLAGHFLAASGVRFDFFQVVFAFLNLALFLPAVLWLRALGRRGARRPATVLLCCLFAASPFVLQNATYAWTKSLAVLHVLAGLWFYLRALRRRDPVRLALGGLAFAAGTLVHYSAAPFALFAAGHVVLSLLRRRTMPAWKALPAALPAALLACTWIAWSAMHFGVRAALGATTTTAQDQSPNAFAYLVKLGWNLLNSLVPHPLRVAPATFREEFFQLSAWGLARDYLFTILQTNLIFAMGSVGGLIVLCILFRELRPHAAPPSVRRYWLAFIAVLMVTTVAVNPEVEHYGVAHVCSQSLVVLGLILLAARFGELPRWLRATVVAGAALDFALGVFFHLALQQRTPLLQQFPGGAEIVSLTRELGTVSDVANGLSKRVAGLTFFGDHFGGVFPVLALFVLAVIAAVSAIALRQHGDLPRVRSVPGAAGLGGVACLFAFGLFVVNGVRAEPRLLLDSAPPASSEERGIAMARAGNVPGAIEEWGIAVALDPNAQRPLYFLDLFSHLYGTPLPLSAMAAHDVRRNERTPEAHEKLGLALKEGGHPEAAAVYFARALELDPGRPERIVRLADTYVTMGHPAGGIVLLQGLVAANPSNAQFHFLLAAAFYRADRRAEAAAELREALRIDPGHAEAAAALRQLGQ